MAVKYYKAMSTLISEGMIGGLWQWVSLEKEVHVFNTARLAIYWTGGPVVEVETEGNEHPTNVGVFTNKIRITKIVGKNGGN